MAETNKEKAAEERKALCAPCDDCDGRGQRARLTMPAVLVAVAAVAVFLLSQLLVYSRSDATNDVAQIAKALQNYSALAFVTALAFLFRSPKCPTCKGTGQVQIKRAATPFLWPADIEGLQTGNRCRRCGYDLTSNTSGKCPECGVEVL